MNYALSTLGAIILFCQFAGAEDKTESKKAKSGGKEQAKSEEKQRETKKPVPLIRLVSAKVKQLTKTGGFSDEDAIEVAKFFFVSLVGEPEDWDLKKSAKVGASIDESSTPELVTVNVSYDFGLGFIGYRFSFARTDKKLAWFVGLEGIPSE